MSGTTDTSTPADQVSFCQAIHLLTLQTSVNRPAAANPVANCQLPLPNGAVLTLRTLAPNIAPGITYAQAAAAFLELPA